jgi:hypothetical protein
MEDQSKIIKSKISNAVSIKISAKSTIQNCDLLLKVKFRDNITNSEIIGVNFL